MKRLIVQVVCGRSVGTAFYVAPDILLTAYHTVVSYKEGEMNVVKDIRDGDLPFTLITCNELSDVALLRVIGRTVNDFNPLWAHHIKIGEEFISFGYPDNLSTDGLRINGVIKQKLVDNAADYALFVNDADELYDYEGMSGAPVLQDGKVVGVVIEQSGRNLKLVSIRKITEYLIHHDIAIDIDADLTSIPKQIAVDVEVSKPNHSILYTLNERLMASNASWLLLYGFPGCGKTTLVASYNSTERSLRVLSRYFLKVPNDTQSRAIRCSESYFVDWIESVYISVTGDDIEKLSLEEKKKRIPYWFERIGSILAEDDVLGVLMIDGLDELVTDKLNRVDDILSLLPNTLPSNINIVLSCTSKDILPSPYIGKIDEENYIQVTPLDMASCESYICDNSGSWMKPYSFIQAVANKTEGHPLYMNYLCRFISENFDESTKEEQLSEWVVSLPSIGGDIRSYYESIWQKMSLNGLIVETLAVLSQIRGSVSEQQLLAMMPTRNAFDFKAAFNDFRHLVRVREVDADLYEIYHSSFRMFISEKLSALIQQTNDQIASYCLNNNHSIYALENVLHHVVCGSNVAMGLAMCNQDWADQCAMNDISPDLVMHDIKECLSFAVDLALPVEVVRLMLLAQRIETRCDSIMADNAIDMANIKIASGKPWLALKYLVRDNVLLVDLDTAISYLRFFNEMGYEDDAFVLSHAVDTLIRQQLSDKNTKGVSADLFVMKGYLIVEGILSGSDDPANLPRFFKFIDSLRAENEEQTELIKTRIRSTILAYQMAKLLRAGKKTDIDETLKIYGLEWNEEMLMHFIEVLALYESFEAGIHPIGYNEAFKDIVKQVEVTLASKSFSLSSGDLELLLGVLIDKGLQERVVLKLLKEYNPIPEDFIFRDPNGVDINEVGIGRYYQSKLYLAFLDESLGVPTLSINYNDGHNWEKYIQALIDRISYINGALYRKKSKGESYETLYSLVREVLDHIDFSLVNRVRWERSYLLPEQLIPFIYNKLAVIYRDYYEDRLADFIEHLQSRLLIQLGLYREGYSAALLQLVRIFAQKRTWRSQTLWLADIAVKYIKYAVQNRGERCSCLLNICYSYALINDEENVDSVYKEVLNSSMGPDWYKEAQLELINRFKDFDVSLTGPQVAHFAAIFEEASGEMTFQRYVQQQKNEFVSTIAVVSSLSDAIEYYKFQTLPQFDRVVKNAEEWEVDMPEKGQGYNLGANYLIESSAICQLLIACKNVSPYVRYAISELFWESWDKMHNDHQYAELHAELFAMLGEEQSLAVLVPRMAEYIVNEYFSDSDGEYLSELQKTGVSNILLASLEKSLRELGYNWKRVYDKQIEVHNKKSSDEDLIDSSSVRAILKRYRKYIVSPIGNYWYSLNEFIVPLIKKAQMDASLLVDVIAGHYDVNVRPSKEQFEKFNWFHGKYKEHDVDEKMIGFLIWFLIHPDQTVASRALESIKWLVQYDEKVVDCLISAIIKSSEPGLATKASEVLLEFAHDNSEIILGHISGEGIWSKLLMKQNFSVSYNLYEIAVLLSEKCGYAAFLNLVKEIIPDSVSDRGEVMIDYDDMFFMSHKIDRLNSLKVTGGKEFAIPYLDEVRRLKQDGRMDIMIRSDKYVRRSFYLDYSPKGRFDLTMEDLLNKLLYGKVDYPRAAEVYNVVNYY